MPRSPSRTRASTKRERREAQGGEGAARALARALGLHRARRGRRPDRRGARSGSSTFRGPRSGFPLEEDGGLECLSRWPDDDDPALRPARATGCRRALSSLLADKTDPFVVRQRGSTSRRSARDFKRTLAATYAVAPFPIDGEPRQGSPSRSPSSETLDGRQLDLLAGIAAQAKLALTNARSFESLERTFLSTVEALANALEAKDEYTSSHARWIRDMAVKVGKELGLDARDPEARRARRAVPRHREDRDPARDPDQARPADRRGAGADRDAPRARRADPRADRAARARAADRPRLPRALRRRRATRTACAATRSRSRPGSSSCATRSTR